MFGEDQYTSTKTILQKIESKLIGKLTSKKEKDEIKVHFINLKKFLLEKSEWSKDVLDSFKSISDEYRKLISDVTDQGNLFLNEVDSYIESLIDRYERLNESKREEARTQNIINSKTKAIDELYILAGKTTKESKPKVNITPNKIKIDFTTLGIGGSLLNPLEKGGSEFEPFAYLAIRYYLNPVDKGLVNKPYFDDSFISKTSIFVGFRLGKKISYRGAELEDLLFNMQPVLGIGYDLSRFITADLGVIGFRQSPLHPFESKKIKRVGLFASINMSLDLFNRFFKAITNKDYKINP